MDSIEQSLLEYRKRPIAISARAIIRAGKGNKYWSSFPESSTNNIENLAKKLHYNLFDPEISTPIKTLDLPLGGSKGIRAALQIIIDYLGAACVTQTQKNNKIDFGQNDESGLLTIDVLKRAEKLTNRITGNDNGSLGLHPAIYYYGPSGVHSSPLFLGTAKFVSEKLANNDATFFEKFTVRRPLIDSILITHKELIATILQKLGSIKRASSYSTLIDKIYSECLNVEVNEQTLVNWAGLNGKIFVGSEKVSASAFSDETKSQAFIYHALKTATKCPICGGYIDTNKSISYDHIEEKSNGGLSDPDNCQITHPYCNNAKEKLKTVLKQAAPIPA